MMMAVAGAGSDLDSFMAAQAKWKMTWMGSIEIESQLSNDCLAWCT
jgi:hypothetical protein